MAGAVLTRALASLFLEARGACLWHEFPDCLVLSLPSCQPRPWCLK